MKHPRPVVCGLAGCMLAFTREGCENSRGSGMHQVQCSGCMTVVQRMGNVVLQGEEGCVTCRKGLGEAMH
jgi:hypothetical protein